MVPTINRKNHCVLFHDSILAIGDDEEQQDDAECTK